MAYLKTASVFIRVPRLIMAISNELSSDIAAAILAQKKNPQELNQLRDVILRVHSTLQKLSEDARAKRFKTHARPAAKTAKQKP